jgi:hypothetical protein
MPPFTGGRDQDEGYTDKKENQIFLICMEQLKSHIWLKATSYMEALPHIWLQLLHSQFPIYEENLNFISVVIRERTLNYHYLLAMCVCTSWWKLLEGWGTMYSTLAVFCFFFGHSQYYSTETSHKWEIQRRHFFYSSSLLFGSGKRAGVARGHFSLLLKTAIRYLCLY